MSKGQKISQKERFNEQEMMCLRRIKFTFYRYNYTITMRPANVANAPAAQRGGRPQWPNSEHLRHMHFRSGMDQAQPMHERESRERLSVIIAVWADTAPSQLLSNSAALRRHTEADTHNPQ